MSDLKAIAASCGFDTVAVLDPATLQFLPEVRDMCVADRCQHYGKSWSCPPANGSLEYWKERAEKYSAGLLLQVIGEREDSYDIEAMMEVSKLTGQVGQRLTEELQKTGADFLFLSAGACTRCKVCTYPDAPCRFPETLSPSMEACGLFVSQVCRDNGVPYYYGDEKIAFTCCLLYNPESEK